MLAGLAVPVLFFMPAAVAVVGALVVLLAVGGWVWLRRVQAEVRAAGELPPLLPWRRSPAIIGAEPQEPAGLGTAAVAERPLDTSLPVARVVAGLSLAGDVAARAAPSEAGAAGPRSRPPAFGPVEGGAARVSAWATPTPESPVVPLTGGIHAILVSAVSGERPVRAAPKERPLPGAGPAASPGEAEDTIEFLPGRLEIVAGGAGDIRFVRQPGPVTEVTLGRQAGPWDRHVRLEGATVSRLHARLRFDAGSWSVANLSHTNPVRLNGRVLTDAAGPQPLTEGDRLEVGEFQLVFRER